VYWIEILKDCFGKKNLKDFKRFCVIVLILMDFKRLLFKGLFTIKIFNQDFNGFIT